MARKATRNAQGGGTIRQRPDGRWEARFTIGRDPGTGRQIQKSVYADTQQAARKMLQQATVAIDDGIYTEPSKLTVSAWLDIWLNEYSGHLKETTLALYRIHTDKLIKPALGAIKLSALTAPTVQAFCNGLQRCDKKGKPQSPKSVKNIHGVLHKALQQAVELGYIRVNPSDACRLPRIERPIIKSLDTSEMARFLEAAREDEFEREMITALFTGMRQAELIGLTWDCVDFQRGTIHLYRQLQFIKGEYKFASLKNDKPRTITPAQFVMKNLQEQRRAQNEWRLLAGPAWMAGEYVFTNRLGEHHRKTTIYSHFKSIAKRIGLPEARFHDLRHTYAISSLQAGDDVKTVQENMGHHTAAFTLDVYGHVTEEMKKQSAARMDTFISGITTY